MAVAEAGREKLKSPFLQCHVLAVVVVTAEAGDPSPPHPLFSNSISWSVAWVRTRGSVPQSARYDDWFGAEEVGGEAE